MSPTVRFAVFLLIVLGIWALLHLYVGWRAWSLPLLGSPAAHRALAAFFVVAFLSFPVARILWRTAPGLPGLAFTLEYAGAVWMGTLFLLLCAFFVVDVLTLGGLVLREWVPGMRTAAAGIGLIISVVALVLGQVGPRVMAVTVPVRDLPAALEGTTVVQVSDLHLGDLVGARRLRAVVRLVEGLEPDLLVMTGDLIDGEFHRVDGITDQLRGLRAPLGVFAVNGNHEYYVGYERSVGFFREVGFTYLENESVEVAPGLVVVGLPDARGARQTGGAGEELERAFAAIDPGAAVILLQHTPGGEQDRAARGVDLMLNGHTHGGQLWPFHYLTKALFPHLAGVYRVGDMTQVVSRGAGRWGPPMRLFAPADVVHATLTRSE